MMIVLFLIQLVSCKNDLVRVDDDHVIAGINVGGIYGLILTAKYSGYLRCKTAEHHAFRVHNVPLAFYGFAFCHIGIHG